MSSTHPHRPISPHLQVYRPQLTSVLSIAHRATGIVLSVGALVLTYWLVALAGDASGYQTAHNALGSLLGRLFLFAFTLSLFYHLCNGVRHLFWDAGYGFDLSVVYASGKAVIAASIVLTVIVWVAAYAWRGA